MTSKIDGMFKDIPDKKNINDNKDNKEKKESKP